MNKHEYKTFIFEISTSYIFFEFYLKKRKKMLIFINE